MKKRIRKSVSLFLTLVMVFSLLPMQAMAEEPEGAIAPVTGQEIAGAEAEAAESPIFLLQPESGSHAPGESYLVTWELDRTPDRLQLVREEPAGDEVSFDEDEPVLVPVRELDPESTELELTAPEEETVFRLRAHYGEEELLSEGFTVTAEPAETGTLIGSLDDPAEPAGEGVLDVLSDDPDAPAALPAEPTPDEPQDDTHYFTTQPNSGNVEPEGYFHVSWATNFYPWKVDVVQYTGYGGYNLVASITWDLGQNMSFDIPYDVAYRAAISSGFFDHGFGIWAYYNNGKDKIFSQDFFITISPLEFVSQPSGGTISAGGSMTLNWETNFRPSKVKIQYNYHQGWKTLKEIPWGEAYMYNMHYTLNYEDAVTADWRILAFYGNGDSDYITSNDFPITCPGYSFTKSPTGGTLNPDSYFTMHWTTDFTPSKIEIGYMTSDTAGPSTFHPKVTLTSGLSTQMNRSLSYNLISQGQTWYIAAWHHTNKVEYSAPFTIVSTPRQFTLQPSGGTLDPDSALLVRWETNFTPTKIELRFRTYIFSDPWELKKTIDTDLARKMSLPVRYSDNYYGSFSIWAYYNNDDYIESEPFPLHRRNHYVTTPEDVLINPEESGTIDWETNFVPKKVEIYRSGRNGSWDVVTETEAILTTGLGKTMSYPVSYDPSYNASFVGSPEWYIRAWYGTSDGMYVTSESFKVTLLSRTFSSSPSGGTVIPENPLTLQWATNFTPVKIVLGYWNGDTWVPRKTLTSGLQKEMSCPLSYSQAVSSDNWRVRAYYGTGTDDFIISNAFSVAKRDLSFSSIPLSGNIYPWSTRILQWTTNFEPVKVEIGYLNGSSWVLVDTVTSNLQMSMKYVLDYAHAATSNNWRIRAFYGTESSEYLQSGSFSIEARSAYICGDNLTAAFADGVLTFSGSGAMYDFSGEEAPWKGIRTSITKVVIPDGVTYIGKYAFYLCTHLKEVTIPGTVTVVGSSAFSTCMALKTVRYGGLRAQWDDVSVAASNDFLTRATFSYLHKTGGIYGSNLGWILDGERNLLIITGSGDGPSQAAGPWLNWAPYIQTIKVEGAASIWDEAFRECTGVTKVYLPDSLTYVGDRAFADCTGITDVYYEGTIYDWDKITIRPNNDPLTDATLHTAPHQEQLTGDLSWSVDDEGLLRIWIDDDLMGDGEDTNIPDFASYTDAPWYAEYHDRIFSLCIEEGVTGIGKNAFRNLQELYLVEIAQSVTYIGNTAFYGCSMLQETLVLPNGIASIGANAFTNCTNTEILILPDSVTTIGAGAFRGCSALYKVVLPAQLQVIPQNCFLNCTRLESIEIPATVTTVGSYAFNDCYALARQQGSVYYGGTSVQWNDIDVKNNNSYLLNAAAYHFTPEELAVNAANFPDANFRSYVAQSFNTDGVLVNGVAYLSEAEIAATELEMDNEGDVTSIQGIEYLTELTYLNLQGVPGLSYADLRQNTALTEVSIGGSLTEIRLDGLRYLQKLYLGGNRLTELDLEGLTNLKTLSIYGNLLTELDVSDFALTRLDVENMPLTELVLGQQPNLSCLYCYGTQLTELDLSGCPLISQTLQSGTMTEYSSHYRFYKKINNKDCWLYIGKDMICFTDHNGLPIDAAHFPDPQFRLYVSRCFDTNRSGTLSDAEIAAVKAIDVSNSDVLSLQGIQYFTELEQLYFYATGVSQIDLSANTGLRRLECYSSQLTALDLSANTALSYLDCDGSPSLTSLNVTGLTALTYLDVSDDGLSALDVSGCLLTYMECDHNPLTSLTLGQQEALESLICYGVQLVKLDISGCPKLTDVWLNGTHTEQSDFLEVANGSLGGYMELDKDVELIGVGGVPVDAEHFPDPNFRGYVSVNFDKNHSGWLSEEEIACAQIIYCGAADIESLQGIEYFTELLELECEDNLITALDLSANTKLTNLDCSYNELTQLSLAGLTELTWLSCEGNALTELDLSDQQLRNLFCHNTSLSALDLSGQTELQKLYCYGTNISSLDLSGCPWLRTAASEGERSETDDYAQYKFSSAILRVNPETEFIGIDGVPVDEEHFPDPVFRAYVESELDGNHNFWLTPAEINAATVIAIPENASGTRSELASLQGIEAFTQLEQLEVRGAPALTSVALSGLPQLESLGFYETGLTALDVSALTLTSLACVDGPLSELILGEQPQLRYLSVYRTQLTALDVWESCPALTNLSCSECPLLSSMTINDVLVELQAAGCAFEELELYGGWLQAADLSNNTALTYLDISENELTALNITGDAALEAIYCGDNHLTSLDLSGNTALQKLYFNSNEIAELDVSRNTALLELDCSGNPLNTLDVSANTALESLCCASVELGSLDLSLNTALKQLECYNCGLTSLDLHTNTALTYLDCDENALTELDLSANPALSRVHVAGNALTQLDLSANPALTYLDARNNASLTQLTLGSQETLSVLWASGTDLTTLDIGMCPILLTLYREVTPTTYSGVMTYYKNGNRLVVDAAAQILVTMTGVCGDDLRWTLSNDGVLTITGTGAMYNYSGSSDNLSPWYSERGRIVAVEIGEGATTIGNSAFLYCTELTDVSLPGTLKSIRSSAFSRCSVLPHLVIPDSVETIYSSVFYDCAGLEFVQLPQGLTKLESETFRGCSSLLEVNIPAGVTTIGLRCFYGCSSMTEVTIPAKVTKIDNSAFSECTSLTEICFKGSAPTIVDSTYAHPFNNVVANVYYPMYDETWTEEIRQNYGGTLTWIPYAPPASPGDLNRDGSVNTLDLLVMRKYLVGLPIEGIFDEAAADVNGDGSIDILDLVRLRKVLTA